MQPPPREPEFRFSLRFVFGAMILAVVLLALALYGTEAARKTLRRNAQVSNLRTVAVGLHNYHDFYDSFPLSSGRDAAGAPHKSWRVEIVNWIQSGNVLTDYRDNEPWNSPYNDSLCRSLVPAIFCSSPNTMTTQIVMPVGPGITGERATKLDDITDGAEKTIALLSLQQTDILWHEPRDLLISEFTRAADNPQRILLQGRPFAGCHCAFADGSIAWLPADLEYDTLMALLTIAGGEKVDLSWRDANEVAP